jgi:hypothetical protein
VIIDLTTDAGFETLVAIIKEGKLSSLDTNTDLDVLVEKQAYADPESFADPVNKLFSIASAAETDISARYAEKCAHDISPVVVDNINEACAVFGVAPVQMPEKVAAVANDMFAVEETQSEKYAGCTEYGTEFDMCLAARALHFPDHAEDYEVLAKSASEIAPDKMVQILSEFDAVVGADLPWIQSRVGTPEYAVFEKRASALTIDLGTKKVPFEKIAESTDVLDMVGVNVDFDEDPNTIKLALERLPRQIKEAIAQYV